MVASGFSDLYCEDMSGRIEIYATCPYCHHRFMTGLYAWSEEGAAQLLAGLKAPGTMIWVFDKTLGEDGRTTVPTTWRCRNCGIELERTQLGRNARAVQADPQT